MGPSARYGAEVSVCPTERGVGAGRWPSGLGPGAVDPDGAECFSMGLSAPLWG